ncbi:MAG: DUF4114 domain-containing protein [Verrucomicrobiota bacterium]
MHTLLTLKLPVIAACSLFVLLSQAASNIVAGEVRAVAEIDVAELAKAELLQSPARPLGLEIAAPVQANPNDEAYLNFMEYGLGPVMSFIDGVYAEKENITEVTQNFDLSQLQLDKDSNVRVYFLKEGTTHRNTLGIDIEGEQKLIFPNASSAHSYFRDGDTKSEYTSKAIPLLPGDYVDVGQLRAGSLVDFFLIQNGASNENGVVFWCDAAMNSDLQNHVKLLAVYEQNTYIIGFEDLPGGGDKDFNDLVIAVKIDPIS